MQTAVWWSVALFQDVGVGTSGLLEKSGALAPWDGLISFKMKY